MLRSRLFPVSLTALIVLSGCGSTSSADRAPAIGEAWAGPATLNLHTDINPKSTTAAVVHHGEKLEIVTQRRRWYKVRTAKGVEGWTDDRALLDTAQMNRLRALANETAGLPSQGTATTFDTLNVHTEPNRQSPSFLQVKEAEKFSVIAHRVLARTPPPKRQLVLPRPKTPKQKGKPPRIPLPPAPSPPPPPEGWVALSKERAMIPEENLPPAAHDDWTLIRTQNDQSGWVLTSKVYMLIPDEVAQYAEGHRITSYFSLGKVHDGDQTKDIWLWTTAVSLGEDHDFDGYRVFTWSLRHHRYETAFIQRRERGFFPVLAKTGEFSVCLENDDGIRIRKQFTMIGNAVRLTGQQRCAAAPGTDDPEGEPAHIVLHEAPAKTGFFEGLKSRVNSFLGK